MVTDKRKERRDAVIATNSQFAVAIHILTLLALQVQSADEPLTSERMAGSVNTNPVFIRRILGSLNRAGLVASQPGVGGGWKLSRDPMSITLLDVYQAVDEGHLLAMPHSTPNPDCLVGRNIQRTLTTYFDEAERAFEQTLAQQTVAQVLQTALEDPRLKV
ncbi:MAG TPA: Rrf2 family transcriptional regulator [Ktedonobacteraceae bacterium]|nr:Rrf2 family transcriptional regulator [Ktedonobacteraceae bacterium]